MYVSPFVLFVAVSVEGKLCREALSTYTQFSSGTLVNQGKHDPANDMVLEMDLSSCEYYSQSFSGPAFRK